MAKAEETKKSVQKKTTAAKTAKTEKAAGRPTAKKNAAPKTAKASKAPKTVKNPAQETAEEKLVKFCEEIAYDRKGENIIRLDLREFSAISDYFVLCTATSEPHIRAIAERIQRDALEKLGIKPLHVDGSAASRWMIVDFGSVMVHVMDEDTRKLYQLESLWSDAPQMDAIKRMEAQLKKTKE